MILQSFVERLVRLIVAVFSMMQTKRKHARTQPAIALAAVKTVHTSRGQCTAQMGPITDDVRPFVAPTKPRRKQLDQLRREAPRDLPGQVRLWRSDGATAKSGRNNTIASLP